MEFKVKYKPLDFLPFSQKGSLKFLDNEDGVDRYLVSYDTKFNSNSEKNLTHQGLFAITYYLFKNKVPYHIHGHNSHKSSMINGTKEKSVFNYEFIEL